MIAALIKTVPGLVFVKPLVFNIVKIVPRLVEHRAAPAANACKDVTETESKGNWEAGACQSHQNGEDERMRIVLMGGSW